MENDSLKDSEVLTLIKKMQQHMVFLEKKIDMILKALPSKPTDDGYRSRRENPEHQSSKKNFKRNSSFKPWYRKHEGRAKRKKEKHPPAKPL